MVPFLPLPCNSPIQPLSVRLSPTPTDNHEENPIMKMSSFFRLTAPGLLAFLISAPITATAQSRVFAPYIDISLSDNNLAQISQASGIKLFTLAFIVGNGCENSWFGVIPVSSDTTYKPLIDALRSAGGDVIISFGGASGVELAGTCTNVSNIQAQYQTVIDKYGVKMLDFDIEGAAVADTAAIDRRNQALAALQKANSGLVISYTLPVEPSGLDNFCLSLLTNAKSHGVNVAVVNVMTMDFGGTVNPNAMGQASIDSANTTISQLQSIGPERQGGHHPHDRTKRHLAGNIHGGGRPEGFELRPVEQQHQPAGLLVGVP